MIPFWLRRLVLLYRYAVADRDRPDLAALARIDDPARFVWAILPHAARTFAACIALMPRRAAMPSAVAYLYCRMLDTYEDLVPDVAARDAALDAFAARLSTTAPTLTPAPAIAIAADRDDRDRAHLLLVQRADLVDQVFTSFDAPTREIIRDLVRDMATGMRWSSATIAAQGGVLTSETQLAEYCGHVLGNPTVFGVRVLRLCYGQPVTLQASERAEAMRVGALVQLANVTRDIEKDLHRGIAYDGALRGDLGRMVDGADSALTERCRAVRERLLRMALSRGPAYARLIDSIHLPTTSPARAAAVLMLLFTERYYRECARRVGLVPWRGPDATMSLLLRSLPTTWSRRRADKEFDRIEQAFIGAAESPVTSHLSPFTT